MIPIPGNSDPALDPVRHLHSLFTMVNAPPDSPAFTFTEGQFVKYTSFTSRLKILLKKAGYDPTLILATATGDGVLLSFIYVQP